MFISLASSGIFLEIQIQTIKKLVQKRGSRVEFSAKIMSTTDMPGIPDVSLTWHGDMVWVRVRQRQRGLGPLGLFLASSLTRHSR